MLSGRDKSYAIILLLLSAAVHFIGPTYPREVVFDEVHFGKFVTAYCCTHERFFDIHPPHAKLIIAGTAYLTGFRGGHSFEYIGQPYGQVSPLHLRLVPMLTGVLLPLVFFALLQQMGAGKAAAFLGGMVLIFDNALTVQTRVVSLDGLLLLAIFGSLAAGLKLNRAAGEGRSIIGWAVLTGVLAGLAVGVKFTGLAALGLLGVLWVWRLIIPGPIAKTASPPVFANASAGKSTSRLMRRSGEERVRVRWFLAGLVGVLAAVVVYAAGWALHFGLLTNPGPGDAWRAPNFEAPIAISFGRETYELHKLMLDANYNLTAQHPDESAWWEWPLMRTSVFYWQAGSAEQVGTIYLLGNPAVWWGSTILLIASLIDVVGQWRDWRRSLVWVAVLGYLISYIPLIPVPRALFLYHYFTPLLFAWIIAILWMDRRGFFSAGGILKQPLRYWAGLSALVITFLIFSPLTFGYLLPSAWHEKLFWLATWR